MPGPDLLDPFERLLDGLFTSETLRTIGSGGDFGDVWQALQNSGFLDALVPECAGGAGLALCDVGPLLQAVGRRAIPLPIGDTIMARALLTHSGRDWPEGPIHLASGTFEQGDEMHSLSHDQHLLAESEKGPILLPRARLADETDPIAVAGPSGAGQIRALAALVRAAAIAGAAARLLEMTIDYANQRVQFGKPIGRQQVVQQNLAVMAELSVATGMACELAFQCGFPPSMEAVAIAKATASAAAPHIAATAHAVHGAIGISEEFDLQLYTRLLHQWRRAAGSEGYWENTLGALRLGQTTASVEWARSLVPG